MKTKAEIVQRLLDEKKITADDAVVLLMAEEKQSIIYVDRPYPVYPANPYQPFWQQPFTVTC